MALKSRRRRTLFDVLNSVTSRQLKVMTLLLLTVIGCASGDRHRGHVIGCPSTCYCNSVSRVVQCARRGLNRLPQTIPIGTRHMNLNGNKLHVGMVQRVNFTHYPGVAISKTTVDNFPSISTRMVGGLEQLYLSDCSIHIIEPGAFSDLSELRWLDLSDNLLESIAEATFNGSRFEHLFLNGNRRLVLNPSSFAGLSVSGLYLHDCDLTIIEAGSLLHLEGTLRTLWLHSNRIQRLEHQLNPLVKSLNEFRVSLNPLHCDCELAWLKRLFDQVSGSGSRLKYADDFPPTCGSPPSLAGQAFPDLSVSQFLCRLPVIGDVDVEFDGRSGQLRCKAYGSPRPEIRWIRQPTDTPSPIVEQSQSTFVSDGFSVAQLVLENRDADENAPASVFLCVANNAAGHVSLTVNVQSIIPHGRPGIYSTSGLRSRNFSSASGSRVIGYNEESRRIGLVRDDVMVPDTETISPARRSKSTCSTNSNSNNNSNLIVNCGRNSDRLTPTGGNSSKQKLPELVMELPEVVDSDPNVMQFVIGEVVCAVIATVFITAAVVVTVVWLVPNAIVQCRKSKEGELAAGGPVATSVGVEALQT